MKTPLDRLIATLDNSAPHAGLDFETYYDKACSVKTLGAWAYCQHPDWDCYLLTVARRSPEGIRLPTYIGDPELFPWHTLAGYRVYSHNAMFDHTVYRRLVEMGQVVDVEPLLEGWDCTADFSAYHCNRRSLADSVEFMFKRTLSKAVRENALGKRWPTAFSAQEQEDMLAYGGVDADECLNIADEAQTKWPDKERLLSRLTRLQGMRGVRVDVDKLDLYLTAARNRLVEIKNDLPWIKDGYAPTSTTAFAQFCRDAKVPPAPVKAHEGEEAFIKWEESVAYLTDHPLAEFCALDDGNLAYTDAKLFKLPKDFKDPRAELPENAPWFGNEKVGQVIKAVADHRSMGKVIKDLEKLKARTDADGIYRFSLKYAGAHTLRWSGDSGFNMQNIMKADPNDSEAFWIVQDVETGALIHTGVIAPYLLPGFHQFKAGLGKKPMPPCFIAPADDNRYTLLDMRSLFLPREGESFVIADSSQIEPRCLAFLTQDREFIELVKQGFDIYEAHARTMHGFTGPKGHLKHLANVEKNQEAIVLRKRSKAERLGLGYQAGCKGYQKAAALLAGLALTIEEALEAVRVYRAANPKVVGFWNRLQAGLTASLGTTFRVKLPSGRFMTYRAVAEERKLFVNPDTKKPEWKTQLTAETDGIRHGYYGGKLTENLTQAMARDVFSEYVLEVWAASLDRAAAAGLVGWSAMTESLREAPSWTVHDELICSVPSAHATDRAAEVVRIMRTTPAWAGDTPFDCEADIVDCYKK